ncbi:MAG: AgmX/PglI C-terminal domain-containing protein [Myxococcales bacterium]
MRWTAWVFCFVLIQGCATTPARYGAPECDDARGNGKKKCVSQKDVMTVVVAHKAGVKECVDRHKAEHPLSMGTMIMRWTILTSGETSDISVVKDAPASSVEGPRPSPFGECLADWIATLKFPAHEVQGEPVTFPVKF